MIWPEELVEYSRSRLSYGEHIEVKGTLYPIDTIIERLWPMLTEERQKRLSEVISRRSVGLIPVFENPYDLGNVSAVMRSCEAFGFLEFNMVIPEKAKFKAANRVARGANKWLDVHIHSSATIAAQDLKRRGYQILATSLKAAKPISEVDFAKPSAVVLGNEKDGVSDEMLSLADENIIIPMQGFTQSFNISVAAAMVFYQARTVRDQKLGAEGNLPPQQQKQVLANYLLRCFDNPPL